MTARARAGAPVLLATALLVACGGGPPRLALDGAREVTLTLTVTEQVSFRGRDAAKALRFALRGAPEPGEGHRVRLSTRVLWAELEYRGVWGDVHLATDGSRDDPEPGDHLNLARRALIERFVDRPVLVLIDDRPAVAGGRLLAISGTEALLDRSPITVHGGTEAVPEAVLATAADGLETLLDETRLVARLRGAGLGPAEPRLGERMVEVERRVEIAVDGRGRTVVAVHGRPGEATDGSPAVRLAGSPRDDAAFTGETGPVPPPEVGAVRVGEVAVVAETQYHKETLRPLRGSLTIELPHAGGPVVRRAAEFLLVVVP